jgi:hypothetical protein
MENYLSKEASSLSHNYEILCLLLIPKFHYHIHKSLPLRLYTARIIQSTNYAVLSNIILPSVPLSPNLPILPLSQSKSATISELHSLMKWIQNFVLVRIDSFYTEHSLLFKYTYIK